MIKKYTIFMFFVFLVVQTPVFGAEVDLTVLIAKVQRTIEHSNSAMQQIVESDDQSECLNLENCRIDPESAVFESYFEDDIDLALEELAL